MYDFVKKKTNLKKKKKSHLSPFLEPVLQEGENNKCQKHFLNVYTEIFRSSIGKI